MSQTRDPLEERDILKVLDALEDERVLNKIKNIIAAHVVLLHSIDKVEKEETKNAN